MRTSEFVTPKHPDKICDQISDAILDECLEQDPFSRVAVETMGGHGIVTITGELTTKAKINSSEIARSVLKEYGYEDYEIKENIVTQSPDIAKGVDTGGAGDQGIMVGYATAETPDYMPLDYSLARSLCRYLYEKFPEDGKTQITVDETKIDTVVASFQNVKKQDLEKEVKKWLKKQPQYKPDRRDVKILCNPAGDWDTGGFDADTGVTGRKLVVDNYGTLVEIGGGAFSGKDPTKVDRSGALYARYLAMRIMEKLILSGQPMGSVKVKLAYAIGLPKPVDVEITALDYKQEPILLESDEANREEIPPVEHIIKKLDLRKPQYRELAKWGHFGNGNLWD